MKRAKWRVWEWDCKGKLYGHYFHTQEEATDFYNRALPISAKILPPEKI